MTIPEDDQVAIARLNEIFNKAYSNIIANVTADLDTLESYREKYHNKLALRDGQLLGLIQIIPEDGQVLVLLGGSQFSAYPFPDILRQLGAEVVDIPDTLDR